MTMFKRVILIILMVLPCLTSPLMFLPAALAENPKMDELVSLPPSKKFHKASCMCLFNRDINPAALVKYKTPADARKAGMTPCKVCSPG